VARGEMRLSGAASSREAGEGRELHGGAHWAPPLICAV
jgi:hypothetical protein